MTKILLGGIFSLLGSQALAGEAVIPWWSLFPSENPCISVSNISNNEVKFKVTLYNKDGSKYLGALDFPNNIVALDQDTILAARETAYFCLKRFSNSGSFGHGLIETSEVEDSNGKSFVVAHSRQILRSGGFHSSVVPINNGQPF